MLANRFRYNFGGTGPSGVREISVPINCRHRAISLKFRVLSIQFVSDQSDGECNRDISGQSLPGFSLLVFVSSCFAEDLGKAI